MQHRRICLLLLACLYVNSLHLELSVFALKLTLLFWSRILWGALKNWMNSWNWNGAPSCVEIFARCARWRRWKRRRRSSWDNLTSLTMVLRMFIEKVDNLFTSRFLLYLSWGFLFVKSWILNIWRLLFCFELFLWKGGGGFLLISSERFPNAFFIKSCSSNSNPTTTYWGTVLLLFNIYVMVVPLFISIVVRILYIYFYWDWANKYLFRQWS